MIVYVDFIYMGKSNSGLTKIWNIESIYGGKYLGTIKWYSNWRKYCFYPSFETIFEQSCLRLISDFIEDQTKIHKENK